MSAAEVIEQIKTLPPGEQAHIFAFVHQYEKQCTAATPGADQSAREAGKWVVENYGELLRKLAQ
jgi:hypothetical protein